ncbi:MAG: 30S ribosomal protein S2 [Candidatus Nitrosocaldaceae archaeon]|nr:MAG: 30S ribosomal protein S2 [Candidatus Nitrosocaldaceae archaeon]
MSVDTTEGIEKMLLSTGIRVGTPVKTKSMTPFIVKANPEGLYILDIIKTLERIEVAASFISRMDPKRVVVCSAREYGKVPVTKFCELTNATPILGRFMPGTFTNPLLPNYTEPLLVIVTDPQYDQQAVVEASKAGLPVIAICNSDNITSNVDLVIPANNRGRKSLATVFWLLTKAVLLRTGKITSEDVGINSFIYNGREYKIDDFETKPIEVE